MTTVVVSDERVPMRDGVLLAADVVRASRESPRPALLIRTPYSRAAMRLVHDVVDLARSGWVVVVQDVRGRFDSGGMFTPFEQEVDDGWDTVEWCSAQGWCDGRVAMTGWSYVGATAWLAAASRHPALLAVNPVVGAGDIDTAMLRVGGAFQIGLVQPWVLGLSASDPAASPEHRSAAAALGARWPELLRSAPDEDAVAALVPWYGRWRRGEVRPSRPLAVDAAAYQIAGWYDVFCESALRHWSTQRDAGRPQRLVIGPWSHSNGLSNVHPELDFGGSANGTYGGVLPAAIQWMLDVLDGRPAESGIACFVMGEGWRQMADWPPATAEMVLHLGADLVPPEPVADGLSITHHPAAPVPTLGGRVLGPFLPMSGPVDQQPAEQRSDTLVFSGPPLADDLVVLGAVTAQIVLETTVGPADVCVTLSDVHPDGRSMHVLDGVRRVHLEPGTREAVTVELGNIAQVFRAGHRIRLRVAGSCFPRVDVYPPSVPSEEGRRRPVVHTVHVRESTLCLPVEA